MSVYDRWRTKRPRLDPDGEPLPPCREHKQYPSIDHGKGERWQVRWRDPDGKQCKRNFPEKAGNNPETCAEAFDAKIKNELNRGEYIDPAAGKVTLRVFGDQWLASQTFDESSRQTVRSRLNTAIYPRLGDRELGSLKPSSIQAFIRELQAKGHEPSYVRVVTGILSSLLGAAVDDKVIKKNPCRASSVRLPKKTRRAVTPWPVERVFAIAAALPKQYAVMADIGYGLGLRQGEILGLALEDIERSEASPLDARPPDDRRT